MTPYLLRNRAVTVLSLVTVIFLTVSLASAESSVPEQQGFVTDNAGILTSSELADIRAELSRYEQETSNEIAVLCISSTDGTDIADRSLEIFRTWGIGKKAKNNGVLMLIAVDDRKMWITTGYGLEGALPDLLVKQIIEKEITPAFKRQEYAKGILQGIGAMEKSIGGEYTLEKSTPITLPLWVFFLFLGIWIAFFVYGLTSVVRSTVKARAQMKKYKNMEDGPAVIALKKASKAEEECAPPKGLKGFLAAFTVIGGMAESRKSAIGFSLLFSAPFAFFSFVIIQFLDFFTGYPTLTGIGVVLIEAMLVRHFAIRNWNNRESPTMKEWVRKAKVWQKLHPRSRSWGSSGSSSSSSGSSSSSSSSSSSGGGSSGGGGAGGSW